MRPPTIKVERVDTYDGCELRARKPPLRKRVPGCRAAAGFVLRGNNVIPVSTRNEKFKVFMPGISFDYRLPAAPTAGRAMGNAGRIRLHHLYRSRSSMLWIFPGVRGEPCSKSLPSNVSTERVEAWWPQSWPV